MDFQQLYALIPKPSVTWSVSDIELWLQFIGLSSYAPQFRSASVDGSCLSALTEEDISLQLKISSKIITKKIMTWIKQGIQCYDDYYMKRETEKAFKQTSLPNRSLQRVQLKTRQGLFQKNEAILQSQKWPQMAEMRQKSAQRGRKREKGEKGQKGEKGEKGEEQGEKRESNELVIKQCQSSIYSCYSLKEQGGIIGRNSKNQIHVLDQNVSRFHAQIDYENGNYFIRDCGSSSGTFIRIAEKTLLRHEQILEMGSNQFLVDLTSAKTLTLKVIEGPNQGETFVQTAAKGKSNVGRKNTNEISFPEDQHLSNIHSTVFAIEGVWYIEDLGTTNGSWIRLSPQGIRSQQYLLQNATQFKLGSSLTYECQLYENNRKTEKQRSDKCQVCKQAERDCIFLPCKHIATCFKCTQSNQISHCISCGSEIKEAMKIYKV